MFECDAKLHIIMEFCPGGDLRTKIQETIHNDDIFNYKQVLTLEPFFKKFQKKKLKS